MPLAIVQTTSYIRNRAARFTFSYKLFRSLRIPENLIRHRPIANYISTLEPLSDSGGRETSESDLRPDFEDNIYLLYDVSTSATDYARMVEIS
ncbi:Tetratricopeptide-like helical [Penicillium freii]|nr:Tetratricopeptide-like helical [Penicillium freii]